MVSLVVGLLSSHMAYSHLEVTLAPENRSPEYLATLVQGFGKIESRERRTDIYVVSLNGKLTAKEAIARLTPKVKLVRYDSFEHGERPMDRKSLRDVRRYRESAEQDLRAGKNVEENEERLEAYGMIEYRLEKRAFPYDSYDPRTYSKAYRQKLSIPPKPNLTDSPAGLWTYMGPRNLDNIGGSATTYKVAGRVTAVAFSPSDPGNTFYIGGANGGVWKTTNGGTTWTPLADDWPYLQVSDIKIDPTNSNRIYVACGDAHAEEGYGMGLMRSQDGGQTWEEVAKSVLNGAIPEVIAIDPDNTSFVHVAATDGLYRSTNGGTTWTKVASVSGRIFDIEIGALNGTGNRYYYAAGESGKIYKSTSRGSSFSLVLNNSAYSYIRALGCSPTNQDTVYAVCDAKYILKSSDAGSSWSTSITTGFPHHREPANSDYKQWSQIDFDYQMVCSTRTALGFNFDVLYVGLFDLSMYAGSNWYELGGTLTLQPDPKIHCDHHDMEIDPTNPQRSLIGTDGGVYLMVRNSDNTVDITNLNANLYVAELWHMNGHPSNINTMLGGIQHQGTAFSSGSISAWAMANRGDGAYTAISPQNGNKQFTSIQNYSYDSGYAYLTRTLDGWATKDTISAYIASAPAFIPPIAMDPSNGNRVYIGGRYISRWNDAGASGSTVDALLGNKYFTDKITAISVAKSDSNTIYVGTSGGEVWRSSNYGSTWTLVSNAGLPVARIESISISLTNASNISVTLGGVGVGHGHIYRCLNTAAGTPSWESRSGSGATALPDLPINTLCRDPNTSDWYAGGEAGCFWSADFGATWYEMTNSYNLPNAEVTMLHAPGNGYLYASTFGRGMWRMKLDANEAQLFSVTLNGTVVVGGVNLTGTASLDQVSPPSGATVTLSSSDPAVQVPSSVFIPGGAFNKTFVADSQPVSANKTVTITASRNGVVKTVDVQVRAAGVSFLTGPASLVNSVSGTYTVGLDGAAPSTGAIVTLTSSNPAALQVPSTTTVPAFATGRTFTATTSNVASDTSVTVTATRNGASDTATTVVQRFGVSTLTISPTGLYSGDDFVGTVTIDRAAPGSGVWIALSATNGGTVPSQVFISTGQTSTTFNGTAPLTASNLTIVLQASLGTSTVTRNASVRPAFLESVSVSPSAITGGNGGRGLVVLHGKAPVGGIVVRLRLLRQSGVTLSAPQTITVPAGSDSETFTIGTSAVSSTQGCVLWATYNGVTKTAQFKVIP